MTEKNASAAQIDLLHGPIFRTLIVFALPILGSNIFQQLYNTMDTVIVGYTLGETSLAAMGACASIYELLVGFALGVGNGLAIVAARSYGSGNRKLLKQSVAVSILIGILLSLILAILAQLILRPLLSILNTPTEIMDEAYSYISTVTICVGVMFAYNLCAGLLRAIGNSLMPLVFLIVSSVLNIGLDLFFICSLHMGVRGAAVATVISQAVSVILCLIYIWKKVPLLIPSREDFRAPAGLYRELLSQGLAMGFMNSLVSAGSVILQSGINNLGYLTIAGHAAARKIFAFGIMPVGAMAQSVNTFVSQNCGAGQASRIRRGVRCSMLYNAAVTALITLLMALAAPLLMRLVSGSADSVIIGNGSAYLRVSAPFYFVLGIVSVLRYSLQGLGQKIRPLFSSVIELAGKILFTVAFVPDYGYTAVIWCEPVIWCFMAADLIFAFYRHPYIRSCRVTAAS